MRELRVLVVSLMYRQYPRALASWEKAIRAAQEWNPAVRFDWVKMYGNPQLLVDGHDIVTHKYREAQQLFNSGGWWALITIEDDMVIPADTFPRLMQMLFDGSDIAYGLYVWRHGAPKWSAYTAIGPRSGRSISHEADDARSAWGKVIEVQGVGLGCTAMRRQVVETIPFRRGGSACNDWYLALDASTQGLRQTCDLGLVCGHMDLHPSPRIYWPDPDQPELYRTEFL